MSKRKRKLNSSVIIILFLLMVIIIGAFLLFGNINFIGKKSIHTGAKKYQTRHCLAFYPDSNYGYKNAKALCKDRKDDRVFDYSLIPYGDYYLVSYGNDNKYFTDKNFDEIKVNTLDDEGKDILLDYLLYEIKKNEPDRYYNSSFLSSININDVDFDKIKYEIAGENLEVDFEEYGYICTIPIKYLQKQLDMNFGYPYDVYRKPVYIDDYEKHPIICLSFNDGPDLNRSLNESYSVKIVELLNRYDANGTFYLTGNALRNREVWADYQLYYFLRRSIGDGNTYGSLSEHRVDLTEIEDNDIHKEISGPIDYVLNLTSYRMNTYRPLSGQFDDTVLENQPVPAILWNIDSLDWFYESSQEIYQEVMDADKESGDIIIMHDIYEESYEALQKIIPELIDQGYQLLAIEDMLNAYNIKINNLKYFYNPNYFE